jgi:hypothetical protein
MLDLFCIVLTLAFFAAAALFVRGLERLARDEEEAS